MMRNVTFSDRNFRSPAKKFRAEAVSEGLRAVRGRGATGSVSGRGDKCTMSDAVRTLFFFIERSFFLSAKKMKFFHRLIFCDPRG